MRCYFFSQTVGNYFPVWNLKKAAEVALGPRPERDKGKKIIYVLVLVWSLPSECHAGEQRGLEPPGALVQPLQVEICPLPTQYRGPGQAAVQPDVHDVPPLHQSLHGGVVLPEKFGRDEALIHGVIPPAVDTLHVHAVADSLHQISGSKG